MSDWGWVAILATLATILLCWSMGYFGDIRDWLDRSREPKANRMARALLKEMTGRSYEDEEPMDVWYTLMARANEIGYTYEQAEKYG